VNAGDGDTRVRATTGPNPSATVSTR
jgi:hypothetical protein